MNAPLQAPLRLPLPPVEVTLIPLDMAAAVAGIHLDHALERVECGEWRWAFDLRAGQEVRRLHVWRQCLAAAAVDRGEPGSGLKLHPPSTPNLSTVIDAVIGTPVAEVRLVSLETRWSVRSQTIRRWLQAGEISYRRGDHTLWLERGSLAAFLTRRVAR